MSAEDDLPTELPLLLAMAFRHFVERLHAQLRDEGREPLRPAHGYVFRFLDMAGGASGGAIAEHLEVTKQAASQLVAELESWGYVQRKPDQTDGRVQVISLTRKGRSYIGHVNTIYAGIEAEWVALLGRRRVDQLRATLLDVLTPSYDGKTPRLRPTW